MRSLIFFICCNFLLFLFINVEVGDMCGRIIGLDQVFGRELMEGK